MNVDKLMTRTVFSCRPEDPLSVAAQIMWERDVGAVPVVDGEQRVGAMITDRDVAMACYLNRAAPEALTVSSAMSKKLLVAKPSQTIHAAEELMRSARVRRLPVVDDSGKLIGVVTLGDMARMAIQGHPRRQPGIEPDDVAVTLAAVTTPRPNAAATSQLAAG